MEHEINELQARDFDWIHQRTEQGKKICERYGVEPGSQVSPTVLDSVFHSWWHEKSSDRVSPEEIANCLGCLFGELLREKFRAEWKIVKDEYGTDLALRIGPSSHTIEVTPIVFVAKRVESDEDESGFFVGMESLLIREIK
jgi:hypothetical protein